MFPLSAHAAVLSINSPVIAGININLALPGIDHRLDRKDHARYQQHSCLAFAYMADERFLMEINTYTMPAEFGNDRITMLMCKAGYGRADIANEAPWLCCLKPAARALFSDRYQILFLLSTLPIINILEASA